MEDTMQQDMPRTRNKRKTLGVVGSFLSSTASPSSSSSLSSFDVSVSTSASKDDGSSNEAEKSYSPGWTSRSSSPSFSHSDSEKESSLLEALGNCQTILNAMAARIEEGQALRQTFRVSSGRNSTNNAVYRKENRKSVIKQELVAMAAKAAEITEFDAASLAPRVGQSGVVGKDTPLSCDAEEGDCRLRSLRDQLSASVAEATELGCCQEDIFPAEFQRRRLHNLIQDLQGQVRVYCRLRPPSKNELVQGDVEAVEAVEGTTIQVRGPSTTSFKFDHVFSPGTQDDVFKECKDLAQSAIDGHNVTIVCYGQTGSGKTHTMYGTTKNMGLAPRMSQEIFGLAMKRGFTVTGSLVELHNNNVIDLLATSRSTSANSRAHLSLRRKTEEGKVSVDGLIEQPLPDEVDFEDLITQAKSKRIVSSHALNSRSSRSHVLLTLRIYGFRCAEGSCGENERFMSKVVFCDLGGSERLKRTDASAEQAREAIEINKSLTAFGDVVESLVNGRRHVPYRNSKLTQLLEDSLGGTAKALLLVNCAPAQSSASETMAALQFASRAQRVRNLPQSKYFSP